MGLMKKVIHTFWAEDERPRENLRSKVKWY